MLLGWCLMQLFGNALLAAITATVPDRVPVAQRGVVGGWVAISQVSHLLLGASDLGGRGQATLMLLVVWWSWNYTTWVTNELDPDAIPSGCC